MSDSAMIGGADSAVLDAVSAGGRLADGTDDAAMWDPMWVTPLARWEKGLGGGHVIVVFTEMPSLLGREQKGRILYDFANEKVVPPGVYLVGQTISSNAWHLPATGEDFQKDCAFIAEMKLEQTSLMILGRTAGQVMLWIDGVEHPRTRVAIPLAPTVSLTLSDLLGVLDRFEIECRSQEFRGKIWKDSAHWVPVKEAEKVVQGDLRLWLRALFQDFTTLLETNAPTGRSDLFMISRSPTCADRAVIELKVVRGVNSEGNPVSASAEHQRILGGRVQVQSYSIDFGAAIRLLCAYDLRSNKDPAFFSSIETLCDTEKVKFASYPILNSSAAAQVASVTAAQSN